VLVIFSVKNISNIVYVCVVYNVITGQYPTSEKIVMELGALQFLHKFGTYDPRKHVVGFLGMRVMEFIPCAHLRGEVTTTEGEGEEEEEEKHRTLPQWEKTLLDCVRVTYQRSLDQGDRKFKGVSGIDPQKQYMCTVMLDLCDQYGCAFFDCSQTAFISLPTALTIAVHKDGK
jgi:hypothetical protein